MNNYNQNDFRNRLLGNNSSEDNIDSESKILSIISFD